ncbi:MAG TPA: TetR/AcrR family transcriptional regulator [Acetobacteraceae bacterium]
MENQPKGTPSDRLLGPLRQAFFDFGYEQPTMGVLATSCGVTRRTLYNHFSNKEEAFRAMLRWRHGIEIAAGLAAGQRVLAAGGSPLDAVVTVMDVRYAEARRDLEGSPHAVEINYTAFRRCRDVMSHSAAVFQDRLAELLADLAVRDLVRLRPGVTPAALSQYLCDGARGVNQTLPPQPPGTLPERYRAMFTAILFGCCD